MGPESPPLPKVFPTERETISLTASFFGKILGVAVTSFLLYVRGMVAEVAGASIYAPLSHFLDMSCKTSAVVVCTPQP